MDLDLWRLAQELLSAQIVQTPECEQEFRRGTTFKNAGEDTPDTCFPHASGPKPQRKGQITAVSAYSSRVLLLADASHALPVQLNRNGLRFIVQGAGRYSSVNVMHVPDTADIREGDLLTTSGLAGRVPPGYPVARVTEVFHDPGQPFARVTAEPMAQLQRSRHFLLLFPPPRVEVDEHAWDETLDISAEALRSSLRLANPDQEVP